MSGALLLFFLLLYSYILRNGGPWTEIRMETECKCIAPHEASSRELDLPKDSIILGQSSCADVVLRMCCPSKTLPRLAYLR
jgi:hypothetical protein